MSSGNLRTTFHNRLKAVSDFQDGLKFFNTQHHANFVLAILWKCGFSELTFYQLLFSFYFPIVQNQTFVDHVWFSVFSGTVSDVFLKLKLLSW